MPDNSPDQDRDSYLRWQGIAITQLGYAINLMMTLSGTMIAFIVKEKLDDGIKTVPCSLRASLMLLGISVGSAIIANVTRALDFRYTRRATKARMKGDSEHEKLHETADCYGKITWRLFYVQSGSLLIGVMLMAIWIWRLL